MNKIKYCASVIKDIASMIWQLPAQFEQVITAGRLKTGVKSTFIVPAESNS